MVELTRDEAIRQVLRMAICIDGEWGESDEFKAHAEGTEILQALGIDAQEIPALVQTYYGSWVVPEVDEVSHLATDAKIDRYEQEESA